MYPLQSTIGLHLFWYLLEEIGTESLHVYAGVPAIVLEPYKLHNIARRRHTINPQGLFVTTSLASTQDLDFVVSRGSCPAGCFYLTIFGSMDRRTG